MLMNLDPATFDPSLLLARLQSGERNLHVLFSGLPGADIGLKTEHASLPPLADQFAEGTLLEAFAPSGEPITVIRERYEGDAKISFTALREQGVTLTTADTEIDYESSTFRTERGQLTFGCAEGLTYRMDELTFRPAE